MGRLCQWAQAVRDLAEQRPWLVAVGAFFVVFLLMVLLVWFIAFSGMSGPVQFVYDSF